MKYIYRSMTVCLLLFSSCNDFLDIKSDATYVIPKSVEDVQALLDDVFQMNEESVPTWGESVIDDYYLTEEAFNSYIEDIRQFYIWNYREYYGHFNDWGHAYAAVYNANLSMELLENIEKNSKNQREWDNVMGSALFFRGFYFYGLLTNFAVAYDEQTSKTDLGIPLRLNSNFNEISSRASVQECFNQIIEDLELSVNYLPDYPLVLTRPSKGAAYAMLAKVYLYQRNYIKALEYCEKALLINSNLMDFNGDDEIIDVNATRTPFLKFNKETIFYAEMLTGLRNTALNGLIDSALYQTYSINDMRKSLFFHSSGGLPAFRGNYTGTIKGFGGLSTNELYLTKSECLAFLDRREEALNVINQLLIKRINGYSGNNDEITTKESILQFIRLERRKELVYRNSRFSDIKRYNKEGANITVRRVIDGREYLLEPNSSKYALPLPADLIDFTNMPQN